MKIIFKFKINFKSFLIKKNYFKKCWFLIEKFSISYTKIGVFIMHFWELCLMKNTLFLKKNGEKIRFFIAFSAIFRDFCEIEKNSQVQIFWAFLKGGPVNIWGDHGQIMGDHGQIMGRSWAMLGFGGFSQLTAGFWWVFAAYGWVFRLACWVFLPYGWVFR